MPENILVIAQEPRDADLVKQAFAGQPLVPFFVNDGDEALRAIQSQAPKLILLGNPQLIALIRQRSQSPILLIASGLEGADATQLGASDLLPRPFAPPELLRKVQQLLARPAFHARPAHVATAPRPQQLTSNDIFGDLLEDDRGAGPGAKKPMNPTDDLDKLLADTLSDVMPQKNVRPKTQAPATGLDKKFQDTLSGLEKSARRTSGGTVPLPRPPLPSSIGEKTHISEPVFAPPAAPVPEEEEPTDGIRFGQYVLLEKIASGGMAEVWKARMRGVEGFQKIVAIKKILPHLSDNQEFIEMFVDEAKLAAQLNHNNIIHIYDLGKIQNSYYIAMEFVDGFDLKTILKRAEERDQPLSLELVLFIASKVAAALDYAHRKRDFEDREMGLVHRDVSPQNVLISDEGDIKLCDFGIAKAASKASHTQAGALKGKLQYMSPEQAWGKAIDRRSDIFALAAVLFEMLTHRKLFGGDNEMSILEQVREARVVPPSQLNDEVTPEIDAIVLKALQKEPANRYQTAAEMAKDIDSLLFTFRPTPTSADLAIFMHRLRTAKPVAVPPPPPEPEPLTEPELKPAAPAAPLRAAAAAVVPMPAWDEPTHAAEKKKSPVIPIAIAAVLALAVVGGFFFIRSQSKSVPAATQVKPRARVTEAPAPSAASATVATVPTETLAPSPLTASTTAAPVLDQAKINEEVQRRLAAQRTKLEQQSRSQQTAPPPSAPPPAQRAAAQPVVPVPQPVAPQPVAAETRPAAAQPVPQPVTETRAAPAPQPAAEAPRVREGDLVTDTDGLVPARMVRRATIPYPPMAKLQRVEGTVLVSALVSETGQVIEVRVIKPINRPVGLNEAAEQVVRRSTFSPPTKDGVRVKAWTTVPIEFKL